MKTKERIVAALPLFNDQGKANVTTNHIAAHLGCYKEQTETGCIMVEVHT